MSAKKSKEELGSRKRKQETKADAGELPPGWTKKVKIRKCGSRTKKDRYYTDPATGYIFLSLKDAQRYLRTGVVGRLAMKPKDKSCVDMDDEDKTLPREAGGDEHELPDRGTDDQMAVQQSSSLVEMKNNEEMVESISTEDHASVSGNAFEPCNEITEVSELPPGWTKEVKIRKTGSKTIKDLYFTDPVTRYVFRSLKDVKRYLKTGELGRLAIKPKNNIRVDMDVEDKKLHTQAAVDEHKLRDRGTDNQMAGQQSSSLVEMNNDGKIVEFAIKKCDKIAEASVVSVPKENVKDNAAPNNVDLLKVNESKQEGKEIAALRHVDILEANGPEQMTDPTLSSEKCCHKRPPENGSEGHKKRNKISEKSTSGVPRRASKRLAGITVDVPTSPPPERITRKEAATGQAREAETTIPTDSASRKEHYEKAEVKNDDIKEADEKQKLPIVVPPASFKNETDTKPHQKQASVVVNPPTSLPVIEKSNGGVKIDNKFSLNDFWTDPCIEFAVKTLTGDIPIQEEVKADKVEASPLKLPLEELWTDPCIEFAVKTLTGAIPVGEDISVHDYFHSMSSTETRDLGTNKSCQKEVLSLHNKHQDLVVPTMQPSYNRNGCAQNPGNGVFSEHVKGRNGQCSRPVFFQ